MPQAILCARNALLTNFGVERCCGGAEEDKRHRLERAAECFRKKRADGEPVAEIAELLAVSRPTRHMLFRSSPTESDDLEQKTWVTLVVLECFTVFLSFS